MNYILLAGVVGLALVIGYLVGRTAEAVRREREQLNEAWEWADAHFSKDSSDLESVSAQDVVVKMPPKEVYTVAADDLGSLYDKLAQERRNRGE